MRRKKGISVSAGAEPPRPLDALDTSDVCALLGLGDRQLRNLINSGILPCEGKGRTRIFRWREVFQAFIDYRISLAYRDGNAGNGDADPDAPISETPTRGGKEDIRQANLRKTRADADLRELTLSKQRREVVVIADARVRLERLLGNLRAQLLAAAPRFMSAIEAERDRAARQAAVQELLRALCFDLSTGAVLDPPRVATPAAPDDPDPEEADAGAADLA